MFAANWRTKCVPLRAGTFSLFFRQINYFKDDPGNRTITVSSKHDAALKHVAYWYILDGSLVWKVRTSVFRSFFADFLDVCHLITSQDATCSQYNARLTLKQGTEHFRLVGLTTGRAKRTCDRDSGRYRWVYLWQLTWLWIGCNEDIIWAKRKVLVVLQTVWRVQQCGHIDPLIHCVQICFSHPSETGETGKPSDVRSIQ